MSLGVFGVGLHRAEDIVQQDAANYDESASHEANELGFRFNAGANEAPRDAVRAFKYLVLYMVDKRFPTLINEAEDILLVALRKAWDARTTYNPSKPFRNWFMTIAYHEAINRIRSPEQQIILNSTEPDALFDLLAEDPRSRSPLRILELQEAYRCFERIVMTLDSIDLQLFNVWRSHNGDGTWIIRASQATGLSKATVRQRVSRCRRDISEQMKKAGHGEYEY